MNWRLFNLHDVIVIVAITAIVHMLARPLYNKIDGRDTSTD